MDFLYFVGSVIFWSVVGWALWKVGTPREKIKESSGGENLPEEA